MRTRKSKVHHKKSIFRYIFIALSFLLITLPILYLLKPGVWDGKDKLIVAWSKKEEVEIRIYDPGEHKLTKIIIPGNTQVELSRNFGEMLLKNVWQRGVDEGISGKLLAETLTRNFLLGVYSNADKLSLLDKIRLSTYHDIDEIKLINSPALKKAKLADGNLGYRLADIDNSKLPTMGVYQAMIGRKVEIKDLSGDFSSAELFGKIIENMGGKVALLTRDEKQNFGCRAYSTDKRLLKIINNIFDCEMLPGSTTNFDLIIILGQRFAEKM